MINIARFDLTSLRIFLIAAREGSLTTAAEHIPITLSAASKRLTELEHAIVCPLFVRHARGLTLTPAGKALYRHVERLISGLERMAREMDDFSQGIQGHIQVWANTSSIIQFLPQSLAGFSAQHPEIKIGLEEKLSHDIVNALLNQQADLGIFAGNLSTQGLEVFTYRHDKLVLLTRDDHPLAVEETVQFQQILPYDFIGLNSGSSLLALLSDVASHQQQTLKLRIQVSSFDAVCHMVAAGMGVSVIPQNVARSEVLDTKLCCIPLLDDWSTRRLLIGIPKNAELRAETRHLYEYLQQEARITLAVE
jgi:DNA-binding transcriptional LysR family regulator